MLLTDTVALLRTMFALKRYCRPFRPNRTEGDAGLLSEPRRGFYQELALFAQNPIVAAGDWLSFSTASGQKCQSMRAAIVNPILIVVLCIYARRRQ